MTDNQKFKIWLEGLSPEKYHKVVHCLLNDEPVPEETLLEWTSGAKEIPIPIMCCIERTSERHGVPLSFDNIQVWLYKNMYDSVFQFMNEYLPDEASDSKENMAELLILYHTWTIKKLLGKNNKT